MPSGLKNANLTDNLGCGNVVRIDQMADLNRLMSLVQHPKLAALVSGERETRSGKAVNPAL